MPYFAKKKLNGHEFTNPNNWIVGKNRRISVILAKSVGIIREGWNRVIHQSWPLEALRSLFWEICYRGYNDSNKNSSNSFLTSLVPCGSAGWYAKITHVLDWIDQVTGSCNKRTCSQDMCATKDKLMPQALGMFAGKFRYRGLV